MYVKHFRQVPTVATAYGYSILSYGFTCTIVYMYDLVL